MAKLQSGSDNKNRQAAIPADGYDAWCYGSVELGTQEGEWKGNPTFSKKIKLFFEIPELPITYEKDGVEVTAPRVINIEYTNSNGKKAKIKPILEAWLGCDARLIDLATDLVGKAARISVINKIAKTSGNTYAVITNISKCKEKDLKNLPPMHNPPMVFSVADHGFDSDNYRNLYTWLKDEIVESVEYQKYMNGADEIPCDASDLPGD